ncbi:CorA family divalent cation transporter, partial [Microvirga aerilata]
MPEAGSGMPAMLYTETKSALIAGVYGMNFENMPELDWHWGYPFGLGVIAVSAILPLIWFKRRGWF